VATEQRIAICGAGVIGASVAYFLSRRGAATTIIERARPGAAASGRAAGFLALDWNDASRLGPLARASFTLHRDLARDLGRDTGYRPIETLHVAAIENGDPGRYRNFPSPAWLDGNVAVISLIGTLGTTAQVEPLRFTSALVDAALDAGAQLRTGTVEGIDRTPAGAVRGVLVDGEVVAADTVVMALGPWTDRARSWLSLPRVHALKGASITLAADVPAQAVFGEYRHRDGRTVTPEIYPRPNGEVYVNGFPMPDPLPDDPDSIAPSELACDELHRLAGVYSSALAQAAVTATRACFRPVTDDGLPLIGPVADAPGVYVATGHASWGILTAPATGRMVAEMILDGRSRSLDAAPFTPSRLLRG
jgi:glycine/D-amino acid oxidase-like deaminating enzyme